MTSEKRRRGRPCGTGKDDTPHLRRVADLLVESPEMTATSAMKQVLRTVKDDTVEPESHVRRLQVKWQKEKEMYLTDAHARLKARAEARRAQTSGVRAANMATALGLAQKSAYAEMVKEARLAAESPVSRFLKELRDDQERIRKLLHPPGYHEIMEQHRKLQETLRGPLFLHSELQEKIRQLTRPFGS